MIIKVKGCKFSRSRAIARSNSNAIDFNDKYRISLFKILFRFTFKISAFGNLGSPRPSLTLMQNLYYRLSTIKKFSGPQSKLFCTFLAKFVIFYHQYRKISSQNPKFCLLVWAKFVIFEHQNFKISSQNSKIFGSF